MKTVHILSDGFHSPNSRGLLYPLIVHRKTLAENGVTVKIYDRLKEGLPDCDFLIIDSKHFHGVHRGQIPYIQEKLGSLKQHCNQISWYDSTDSAGWIAGEILPLVDRYIKSQLLRDRNAYLQPMYGRRVYTDFYHHHNGITDEKPDNNPQVWNPQLLQRIVLGWNSGLANYTLRGPLLMTLYEHLPIPSFLQYPSACGRANRPRPVNISCRMGTAYQRNTVAFQRKQLLTHLPHLLSSRKLKRGAYFTELKQSRAVISPFGLGEITLKDFEVFLSGALLVKPDMDHIETWPDLYENGKTILSFAWDFNDINLLIENIENNPKNIREIAERGQRKYLKYIGSQESGELFYKHFAQIIA